MSAAAFCVSLLLDACFSPLKYASTDDFGNKPVPVQQSTDVLTASHPTEC